MDPFRINGPTCLSFSGGRTSAYMLRRVLDANEDRSDLVVCFANTGKEEEATLRFVRECSLRWDVPIVWVEYRNDETGYAVVDFDTASRDGEPFAAIIAKRQYLPNPVTRFCTIELKIRPIARVLRSLGFDGTLDELENNSMIGMRADEPRRAARIAEKWRIPLWSAGITSTDIAAFWSAQPFDLELPSHKGRTLAGNCDLCFLKPANQIATLIAQKPERAVWWAAQEKKATDEFVAKRIGDGWRFRMDRPSYAAMLANAQNQTDAFGFDDEEAIACFCGE